MIFHVIGDDSISNSTKNDYFILMFRWYFQTNQSNEKQDSTFHFLYLFLSIDRQTDERK